MNQNVWLAAFAEFAYIRVVSNETLGRTIRRLRLEAEYTLRGFAELVDISAAYQSDIEHDRRVPTEDVLRRISKVLARKVRVTYDELRDLSVRIDDELQQLVQSTPEIGRLLREVKQSGRPARDVLRELQEQLQREREERKR